MITVRNLQDTDILTLPYWHIPGSRPCNNTTLVAIDNDKMVGLAWFAYGGEAALIGLFVSADSKAVWPLWNASKKLARDLGCKTLIMHVKPGRLLNAYVSRGGVVVEEGAHVVVFSTERGC